MCSLFSRGRSIPDVAASRDALCDLNVSPCPPGRSPYQTEPFFKSSVGHPALRRQGERAMPKLAVQFDAHCCHLNIAEAAELIIRLVKVKCAGPPTGPPDGCMQRRIQKSLPLRVGTSARRKNDPFPAVALLPRRLVGSRDQVSFRPHAPYGEGSPFVSHLDPTDMLRLGIGQRPNDRRGFLMYRTLAARSTPPLKCKIRARSRRRGRG